MKALEKLFNKAINNPDSDYCEITKCYEKVKSKLKELKKIEEELGVDLITLFKALRDGIWVLVSDDEGGTWIEFIEPHRLSFSFYRKQILIASDITECIADQDLKYFGTKWALKCADMYHLNDSDIKGVVR